MERKRSFSIPAVGVSSLLAILAVLCLTVFAVLSISTVQADARLSDSAHEAMTGYYAADCRAEETVARLRAGETVEGVSCENGVYSFYCTVSDTQVLAVEVQEGTFAVLRWQTVSTTDWQPDDRLPVWTGPEQ